MRKLNSENNIKLVEQGLAQYTDYNRLLNDNEINLISQFLMSEISSDEINIINSYINGTSKVVRQQNHIEFFNDEESKFIEYCKWIDKNHFIATLYKINKQNNIEIKQELYKTNYPLGKEFTWLASKKWDYDNGFLSLISSQDCFLLSENLIFLNIKQEEYQRYQKCLR